MRKITKLLFLVTLLFPSLSHGFLSPLGFSILPPVQLPPNDFSIVGARFSAIWGKHHDVYGVDLGAIGNITEQSFGGTAVSGIFNINQGDATVIGLQAAGITNINTKKATIVGLQAALGLNYNVGEATLVGLQVALGNSSSFTKVYGAQIGLYNSAIQVTGFQLGLVNWTENLRGIQIGLVNFNTKGLFSVAPILNVGF